MTNLKNEIKRIIKNYIVDLIDIDIIRIVDIKIETHESDPEFHNKKLYSREKNE